MLQNKKLCSLILTLKKRGEVEEGFSIFFVRNLTILSIDFKRTGFFIAWILILQRKFWYMKWLKLRSMSIIYNFFLLRMNTLWMWIKISLIFVFILKYLNMTYVYKKINIIIYLHVFVQNSFFLIISCIIIIFMYQIYVRIKIYISDMQAGTGNFIILEYLNF